MKIIGIIRSQMCSLGTTRDCGNRLSFLQACEGMIALYKQRKDKIQWNRLSFLQACEGMIALYKQRKDKTQWNRYNSYKLAKA